MENLFEEFFESLKEQEKKYGVSIQFSPDKLRDEKHLDCIWYGGEVGKITYRDYQIVIGAYGEIRLYGRINGEDIHFVGKNNVGEAYREFGNILDDESLYKLLDSNDPDNQLTLGNNNWFEVDLISPDGKFIDLFGMDNVLCNNILDCFSDVSEYFKFVDWEMEG